VSGRQRATDAHPLTIPRDPVPGVNLAGFLEGELGLGEVARMLGRALERANVPFAAIPIGVRRAGSSTCSSSRRRVRPRTTRTSSA
jgi:hypothetical protein